MTEAEIKNIIKNCIQKVTRLSPNTVEDHKDLRNVYGLDSLDFLTVRLAVEEVFNVTFADENLANMMTVQEIFEQVAQLQGNIQV